MPKSKKFSKKYKKKYKPLQIGGNTFRIQNGRVILTKSGRSLTPQQLKQLDEYSRKHNAKSFSQYNHIEQPSCSLEDFFFYSNLEFCEDEHNQPKELKFA